MLERHFRLKEVTRFVPYSVATLRKKILNRELAYRKVGRAVMVPESEIRRLLGALTLPIALEEK